MGKMEWAFLATYLGAYAASNCPHPEVAGLSTTLGFALMAVLALVMLVQRLQFVATGFIPPPECRNNAVFIAGCDQAAGWQLASRFAAEDVRVYAALEDPGSSAAEWLRRHLRRNVVVVPMRSEGADAAAAAARLVQDTLGDLKLVAVVYARHNIPTSTKALNIREVQRGIEIGALGAVNLAQAFAPLLSKYKGRFVIIADLAGRLTLPSLLPYCMSQAVALQFTNIIRKYMEKFSVSVHVIEVLLHSYQKTQENVLYPEVERDSGKVIVPSKADKVDLRLFLLTQCVFKTCLIKNPKTRYLTSFTDYFLDKLIRYSPAYVHNMVVNGYLKCIKNRKY